MKTSIGLILSLSLSGWCWAQEAPEERPHPEQQKPPAQEQPSQQQESEQERKSKHPLLRSKRHQFA